MFLVKKSIIIAHKCYVLFLMSKNIYIGKVPVLKVLHIIFFLNYFSNTEFNSEQTIGNPFLSTPHFMRYKNRKISIKSVLKVHVITFFRLFPVIRFLYAF